MGLQHLSKERRQEIARMGGKASGPGNFATVPGLAAKVGNTFAKVPGLASRAAKCRKIKVKHIENEDIIDVKRKLGF